jgi:hypothetical protein
MPARLGGIVREAEQERTRWDPKDGEILPNLATKSWDRYPMTPLFNTGYTYVSGGTRNLAKFLRDWATEIQLF